MKNLIISLISFSTFQVVFSQSDIDTVICSKNLSAERMISIHLPSNFTNENKSYPVLYLLDGEYTKLAVNGVIDYYSYCKKIPDCIVVSIHQNFIADSTHKFARWNDCSYSWKTGELKNKGVLFKRFIAEELVPLIDSLYPTTSFKAILGHSFTANYVNYFLLDDSYLFDAYVAISPYYAENYYESLKNKIAQLRKPIFYFVTAGKKDLSGHKQSVSDFNNQFSKFSSDQFFYQNYIDNSKQGTHYTILTYALPFAIEHIFSKYKPLSENDFQLAQKASNKLDYLKNSYERIAEIYGLQLTYREEDLQFIAYVLAKSKSWNELLQLGELTIGCYPNSYAGYWMLGQGYEQLKNYEQALRNYQFGKEKLGADCLNVADFQKDIDRVTNKIKRR